ncbi:hypothetical protein L5515_016708 [Caenorhabditis briggsae]|uniref:Uncharacterized protein n=1 Tax=Caenorhabditis briggsae TaxID=6238 RepID=A0AAE9FBE5_CAEBR|nr:hypothetical protein L3Y34_010822 [Caenorhabditis briggsae]UMM39820.1 hypothetical protein L5515_016708 [Caenorhabditis briggsae]
MPRLQDMNLKTTDVGDFREVLKTEDSLDTALSEGFGKFQTDWKETGRKKRRRADVEEDDGLKQQTMDDEKTLLDVEDNAKDFWSNLKKISFEKYI